MLSLFLLVIPFTLTTQALCVVLPSHHTYQPPLPLHPLVGQALPTTHYPLPATHCPLWSQHPLIQKGTTSAPPTTETVHPVRTIRSDADTHLGSGSRDMGRSRGCHNYRPPLPQQHATVLRRCTRRSPHRWQLLLTPDRNRRRGHSIHTSPRSCRL